MIFDKSREKKEKMCEGKKERRTKWLMERKYYFVKLWQIFIYFS